MAHSRLTDAPLVFDASDVHEKTCVACSQPIGDTPFMKWSFNRLLLLEHTECWKIRAVKGWLSTGFVGPFRVVENKLVSC